MNVLLYLQSRKTLSWVPETTTANRCHRSSANVDAGTPKGSSRPRDAETPKESSGTVTTAIESGPAWVVRYRRRRTFWRPEDWSSNNLGGRQQ